MTTPDAERDPYAILKDAVANHLLLVGLIPTDMDGDEAMSLVYDSAGDLDAALGRAKAAQAATDTGGTSLELTLEEARTLRALLHYAAMSLEPVAPVVCDGVEIGSGDARALRKRINAGVRSRCEARTTTTDETFRPRPADACASSDDEEVAT